MWITSLQIRHSHKERDRQTDRRMERETESILVCKRKWSLLREGYFCASCLNGVCFCQQLSICICSYKSNLQNQTCGGCFRVWGFFRHGVWCFCLFNMRILPENTSFCLFLKIFLKNVLLLASAFSFMVFAANVR